jgi:hypothetical protein
MFVYICTAADRTTTACIERRHQPDCRRLVCLRCDAKVWLQGERRVLQWHVWLVAPAGRRAEQWLLLLSQHEWQDHAVRRRSERVLLCRRESYLQSVSKW